MFARFLRLRSDQAGSVTVDWVAMTAAVVSLAAVGVTMVDNGVGAVNDKTQSKLEGKAATSETDAAPQDDATQSDDT